MKLNSPIRILLACLALIATASLQANPEKEEVTPPVAKNRPTDNPAKEKAIPNIERNGTPATEKAIPVILDLPWKDIERPSEKG